MAIKYLMLHLLCAALAAATPVLPINACALETALVEILRLDPEASTFCSSFLSIRTQTMYVLPYHMTSPVGADSISTATSTVTPAPVTTLTTTTDTALTSSIIITTTVPFVSLRRQAWLGSKTYKRTDLLYDNDSPHNAGKLNFKA